MDFFTIARRVLFAFLAVGIWNCAARSATVDEIIALSRAGTGEQALIALVEKGEGVTLPASEIGKLMDAKVPEPVIVAMLKRKKPAAPIAGSAPASVQPEPSTEKYGGIGASLRKDGKSGYIIVSAIYEGQAAANAGLRPGDVIVDVDSNSTNTETFDDTIRRVRGPIGSAVVIGLLKPPGKDIQKIRIVRQETSPAFAAKVSPGKQKLNESHAALKRGDPDAAIVHFNKAVEVGLNSETDFVNLYLFRGLALYFQEEFGRALLDLDKALKIAPNDPEAIKWKKILDRRYSSHVLDCGGKTFEDMSSYLNTVPADAEGFFLRGRARGQADDLDGAIRDYDNSIKLDPGLAKVYRYRGRAKREKKMPGALADFERSLALDPKNEYVLYLRANERIGLMDFNGAIADFNRATELNPKFLLAYVKRGQVREQTGDTRGAIADCSFAIAANPESVCAHEKRGSIKNNHGDYRGALADFEKAAELDPQRDILYFDIALAKFNLKNYRAAIALCTTAISLNAKNSDAYHIRGRAKASMKNGSAAMADYNAAIALNANDAEYYYARARLRWSDSDRIGARQDIDRTLKLDPKHKYALQSIEIIKAHQIADVIRMFLPGSNDDDD